MGRRECVIEGSLVSLPLGKDAWLDGFWHRGRRASPVLLVFQHGLSGNFYSGVFKKALMVAGRAHDLDVLAVNNSGHDRSGVSERFTDCLRDLDVILRFGRARGYRRFALVGHSTGCQKVTYYLSRRAPAGVKAVVLLAPADDYAISRRELGSRHAAMVRRARRLVAGGRGATLVQQGQFTFTSARFLSVADPSRTEAGLFDYSGPMRRFARLRCPVLALFGSREEYACMPVKRMGEILRARSRAPRFDFAVVQGADHSFRGREARTAGRVCTWVTQVV